MPEQEVGKALLTAALAARENAYAPYSGFKVGAAVLDEHGRCLLYTSPSPRD